MIIDLKRRSRSASKASPPTMPEIGLVDHAIVGERAAAGAAVEPPADDPPAAFVEDHRQHAVEHAGRADLLEPHRVDEGLGVEPDDFEGQPLGGGPVEIEDRLLEDQAAAHERPFAALDPTSRPGSSDNAPCHFRRGCRG